MNYKINEDDIKNIKTILEPFDGFFFSMTIQQINGAYEVCKNSYNSDLKDFDLIYRADLKGLIHVYEYFMKERNIDLFTFCEDRIIKGRQSSSLLNFFRTGLDAKLHTISDEKISMMIDKFIYINKRDFDNLLKISLRSDDVNNKLTNFFKVLEKSKRFKFSALEEEKIETLFNKKFPKEIQDNNREKIEALLPSLKKNIYLIEETGFYYKLNLDLNILSKINRINSNTICQSFTMFFNSFKIYIKNSPQNKMKLKEVELETRNFSAENRQITFNFSSDVNFEHNKLIINKLLNHCFTPLEKALIGNIAIKNPDQFFDSFLMHEFMNQELSEKTKTTKKIKI